MLHTPREPLQRLRNALVLTLLLLVVRMLPSMNFPFYPTAESLQSDYAQVLVP